MSDNFLAATQQINVNYMEYESLGTGILLKLFVSKKPIYFQQTDQNGSVKYQEYEMTRHKQIYSKAHPKSSLRVNRGKLNQIDPVEFIKPPPPQFQKNWDKKYIKESPWWSKAEGIKF